MTQGGVWPFKKYKLGDNYFVVRDAQFEPDSQIRAVISWGYCKWVDY